MMRVTPATSAQSLTGKGLTVSQVSARGCVCVCVRERDEEEMTMMMSKKKEKLAGKEDRSRNPGYDINIS